MQPRVNHFKLRGDDPRCRLHLTTAIVLPSDYLAAKLVQVLAFFQGDVSFFQSLRRPGYMSVTFNPSL